MLEHEKMFTTVVLVEVEISHWGTCPPKQIIDSCVISRLTGPTIPAVKSCEIKEAYSDYVVHGQPDGVLRKVSL